MRNAFRYLKLTAILALILNFGIFFNRLNGAFPHYLNLIAPFVHRLEISGSSWANMRIGIFVYHQFQEEIQVMHWVITMLTVMVMKEL